MIASCVNIIIECTDANLDGIADNTPRLYGSVYSSYATGLYSRLPYWILMTIVKHW